MESFSALIKIGKHIEKVVFQANSLEHAKAVLELDLLNGEYNELISGKPYELLGVFVNKKDYYSGEIHVHPVNQLNYWEQQVILYAKGYYARTGYFTDIKKFIARSEFVSGHAVRAAQVEAACYTIYMKLRNEKLIEELIVKGSSHYERSVFIVNHLSALRDEYLPTKEIDKAMDEIVNKYIPTEPIKASV